MGSLGVITRGDIRNTQGDFRGRSSIQAVAPDWALCLTGLNSKKQPSLLLKRHTSPGSAGQHKHHGLQVSGGTPEVVNERDAPAKANATVNTVAHTKGRFTACNTHNIVIKCFCYESSVSLFDQGYSPFLSKSGLSQ